MSLKPSKNYKSIWSHISQVFHEFCESTSLHGYSYLASVNSIFVKLLWICGILSMSGLGIMFLYKNTMEYFSSTLVTSIESSTTPLTVSIPLETSYF